MEKNNLESRKIGEIVTDNFKAAGIFKKYGMDFCCGGNSPLKQACDEKNIDPAVLTQELMELAEQPADAAHNFKEWNLGFLCDYIVNTHHQTVTTLLPRCWHTPVKLRMFMVRIILNWWRSQPCFHK
jgi:regulator of cell morphogenesis and NO signaling